MSMLKRQQCQKISDRNKEKYLDSVNVKPKCLFVYCAVKYCMYFSLYISLSVDLDEYRIVST